MNDEQTRPVEARVHLHARHVTPAPYGLNVVVHCERCGKLAAVFSEKEVRCCPYCMARFKEKER